MVRPTPRCGWRGIPSEHGLVVLRSVVFDLHPKPSVDRFRAKDQIASIGPLRDAMPDGIFHERLKQKTGHLRLLRRGIDGIGHVKPGAEANLFESEILLGDRNLFLEGDLVRVRRFEGPAQQVGQARNHLGGDARLIIQHQGGDRVQRIEQEVWLKLIAKGAHLGLARHQLEEPAGASLLLQRVVVLDAEVEEAPCRQEQSNCRVA